MTIVIYGLGHTALQADADSAYTQSQCIGTPTWVALPPEAWPSEWRRVTIKRNPVCRPARALYGHPDAGGYWEQHCEPGLLKIGFVAIVEEWRSCVWHERLKLVLVVYVDGFELSGPAVNVAEGWGAAAEFTILKSPPYPSIV